MNSITLTLLAGLLISCGKKSDVTFSPSSQEVESVVNSSEAKSKVFFPHCIRCHSNFALEFEVRKEVTPGHPEESHLFEHVSDGTMPPDAPPLKTEELELLRNFIEHLSPQAPEGGGGH